MADKSYTKSLELLIGFLGESAYIFHFLNLISYYMNFLETWNCKLKILRALFLFREKQAIFMLTL